MAGEHSGDRPRGTWDLNPSDLEEFFTLSLDMLCISGSDGYFKWLNPAFSQTLGWTIDELLARPFTDFIHPDDRAATLGELKRQIVAGEKVYQFDNRYQHKDGSWRVLSWKSVPNGNVVYAVARDVTERNRLERALQESNAELERRASTSDALYRHMVELSHDGIWIHQEGKILFANPAAARMFRAARPEDLIGRPNFDLVHPDDRARAFARTGRMVEEGVRAPLTEMKFIAVDGTTLQLEVHAVSFTYHGKPAVIAVGRDVSERKLLEDQLRQAQKMEAIGQLTGGIAHDFNNLLGVVIGNLDDLIEQFPADSQPARALNLALKGALHGAELTHRLLAFARKQTLEPRVLPINEMLPDVVDVLRRTLGEDISVRLSTREDLWTVFADPSQVRDALMNLAINARDAMPNGGTLTIKTDNVVLDETYAKLNEGTRPGEYAMLAVTDTGVGMSPEVMQRAFEPFFTTKSAGKGTGLGLAMIYGFARQSGGHLKIESEVGRGTTVKLYLPRTGIGGTEVVLPPSARGELPHGAETILLVEDNDDLRRMAAAQLSGLGYRVIEAQNGEAALAVLKGTLPIDLLFSDVVMSGQVTGHDLAREAPKLRPGIQILLSTGYAERAVTSGEDGIHLLRKPYRRRDLALKVRSILDRG